MMGDSIEETRQHHVRYLRAISSPLRRQILRAVKDGYTTIEDLRARTKLDEKSLNWHLDILDRGFCVEKQIKEGKSAYGLTHEGEIVDFLE
jgi:DNA-binding transcriptional ArsR family regulator